MDVTKLLASVKLPQTSVKLCLDGQLADEYAAVEQQLAQAKSEAKKADSMSAGTGVRALEAQLEKLRKQAEASTVTFKLRAVGRKRWTELMAEHPPREGNTKDTLVGANEDTLAEALIREGLVEPLLSAEQLATLLDEHLSEGQYNELANAAYFVNRRSVSVPFS